MLVDYPGGTIYLEPDYEFLVMDTRYDKGRYGNRVFHNFVSHVISSSFFFDKWYLSRFSNGIGEKMAITVPKDEYIAEFERQTALIKDLNDEELAIKRHEIETNFWKIRVKEQAIIAEQNARDKERKNQQRAADKTFVSEKISNDTGLATKLAEQLIKMKDMGLPESAIEEVKKKLAEYGKSIPTLHVEATKKD